MQLEIKKDLPYLNGWYFAEWSNQLKKGEVRPIKLFGEELVICRNKKGKVSLYNAHCPHLGAHLGQGGKIKGENLVCPFHKWEFNPEGEPESVPYACKINKTAKLRVWNIYEANGIIFTFYHSEGEAPTFDIPKLPEFEGKNGWSKQIRKKIFNKAYLQDVVENAVDIGHFSPIHLFHEPKIRLLEFKNHTFKTIIDTKKGLWGLKLKTDLEIFYQGPGFAICKLNSLVSFKLITAVTPVDEDHLMHTFSFVFKKSWNPIFDFFFNRIIVKKSLDDYSHDINIWAHKVYLKKPKLVEGEGPIIQVRNWLKQFETI